MAEDEQLPELTLRDALFVDAYTGAAFGDATKAAKLAGSPSTGHNLQTIGSRILHKPAVQAVVKQKIQEIISEQEIVTLLADIARDTAGDRQEQYDQRGNLIQVVMNRQDRIRAMDILTHTHSMRSQNVNIDVVQKALIGVDLDKM